MDYPLIRGRRLRVTKLDGCGAPVEGPASTVVTGGFVTLAFAPNNRTIDGITVTNAYGENEIDEPAQSKFSNYTVTGTFAKVMPELFSLMTGMPVVHDAAGAEAIGIRINSQVNVDLTGFAAEVWSKVPQQVCTESGDPAYGYTIAPFIKGGVLGGITFENNAITFSLEAATTQDGNDWGSGPYNVEMDDSVPPVAAPLNTPLDPYDHLQLIRTEVAPPAVTDGAVALVVP